MTPDQIIAASLQLQRRPDGWWIIGEIDKPMGPYKTRALAQEDRRGVKKFYRNCNKRGFITQDSHSTRKAKVNHEP